MGKDRVVFSPSLFLTWQREYASTRVGIKGHYSLLLPSPGPARPGMRAPALAPWKSVPFQEGKLFSKGNAVLLLKQNPQVSEASNCAATHNGETLLSKQSPICSASSPDPLLGPALLSSLFMLISRCPSFLSWEPGPAPLPPQADANCYLKSFVCIFEPLDYSCSPLANAGCSEVAWTAVRAGPCPRWGVLLTRWM